ncbi:MAG: ribonuclease III domain-containing protein [Oscillospiraceae bacterium]|nr:ribonuclease III domain-containing protein [Oscillospiraceae bacterium]
MLFNGGTQIDIREYSPLALAFAGDGVLELLVRGRAVREHRLSPGRLHALCVKYVSAKGQALGLAAVEPLLTEREKDVVRRGKNASKATVAKHATAEEYRASTGFEALLGYLYLTGENQRIEELFDAFWQRVTACLEAEKQG